jgi:glycosyltransferase involved in cell wall biosynthesis
MTKSKRKISSGMNAEGFETVTVPTRPYFSNVSFLRLYSHWKYALTWQAMALKEIESKGAPDVIVVSSPPLYTGSVARRIAKKTGAKVIVDVMDAWPETFARIVPEMLLFPLKVLARKNYLCADGVSTVSDRYVSLVGKYGRKENVARFYHGIEILSDVCSVRESGEKTVKLVYAGNLGVTYDIKTVLRGIAAAKEEGLLLSLDIAGKGSRIEAIRSLVKELALQNCVRIHGYLGAEELSILLSRCDIGIIPMPSDSFVGVPYKLADYAKANLPCVSSLGGEVTALLEKYSCGATYKEGDAVSFLDAVKKILPKMAEAKKGARDMANQEFDAKKIYAEYVLFAEKIVSMKDRRKVL